MYPQKRVMLDKITPALLSTISQELFSVCVIVLGNKAYETSASWNYTLLGYTPECFEELVSVKITRKEAGNCTNMFWESNKQ